MDYPKHIYDSTRRQIATELMQKELFKKLPSVSIEALEADVTKWNTDDTIIDFWDNFAAIMESMLLKSRLTSMVTAANYAWQFTDIPVGDIQLSAKLSQLDAIPALEWHDGMTVGEIIHATNEAGMLASQREANDARSSAHKDKHPIIAVKSESGTMAMDGNRRSLRAGLYGKQTVAAWVATTDGSPRDYWVPVNDLFQVVNQFRLAKTDNEKTSVRNSLELCFRASTIARINYDRRVSENKWARELLEVDPTI